MVNGDRAAAGLGSMHPMFVKLFIETDADDLLDAEETRQRRTPVPAQPVSHGRNGRAPAPQQPPRAVTDRRTSLVHSGCGPMPR